jgi:rubrerythrin
MPDKVLICQSCHSPFVYSEYEQIKHAKESQPEPIYCPICSATKAAEAKRPSKPIFNQEKQT